MYIGTIIGPIRVFCKGEDVKSDGNKDNKKENKKDTIILTAATAVPESVPRTAGGIYNKMSN